MTKGVSAWTKEKRPEDEALGSSTAQEENPAKGSLQQWPVKSAERQGCVVTGPAHEETTKERRGLGSSKHKRQARAAED